MKRLIARIAGLFLNVLSVIAPRKAAKLGFEFFLHPFRTPLNSKQVAFLDTGAKSTLDFDGVAIQTYSWGKGPRNLVLVHGWQSHTYRWKAYIEAFTKLGYTVHAFDAPGHGRSGGKFLSVPLYSEVIEAVLKKVGSVDVIIGHSLGGFSSIYTLHRLPDLRVGRLVALAPPGEAQEFFDYYRKSLGLSQKCTQLIADYFEARFQKPPRYFSAPVFAASLQVPGLLIHDEGDDETSVEHARRIHSAWKKSRLVVTRGFGHNLKSTEVIREIEGFINPEVILMQDTAA